jgi:hypothetical protein
MNKDELLKQRRQMLYLQMMIKMMQAKKHQ